MEAAAVCQEKNNIKFVHCLGAQRAIIAPIPRLLRIMDLLGYIGNLGTQLRRQSISNPAWTRSKEGGLD